MDSLSPAIGLSNALRSEVEYDEGRGPSQGPLSFVGNANMLPSSNSPQPESGNPAGSVSKSLVVAIDYDGTFTSDPQCWTAVIHCLRAAVHRVICVSARTEADGSRAELRRALPAGIDILLSEFGQKRQFAKSQGWPVDIWIEDHPESVPSREDLQLCLSRLEILNGSGGTV